MLQNAVLAGTGSAAAMDNIAVAGKTGTSNDNQTRWFAGYTPYYTAVVWCGYDEPEQIILDGDWTNPAISMWIRSCVRCTKGWSPPPSRSRERRLLFRLR